VEKALLAERSFRHDVEAQLDTLQQYGDGSKLREMVDTAVASALEQSGTAQGMASLDEKVKECGRLIVRMGTELMEETKRRQALEAEVQELRMRLSGVEAVARSPLGPTWPGATVASSVDGVIPPLTMGLPPGWVPPVAEGFDGGIADPGAGLSDAAYASAFGFDPIAADDAMGSTSQFMNQEVYSASAPLLPTAAAPEAMGHGDGAAPATWNARCSAAVDTKLQQLVPALHAASLAAPPAPALSGNAALGAAGLSDAADSLSVSQLATASYDTSRVGGEQQVRGSAALRLSRQELDARVQQILGRHGRSLSAS